MQDKPKSYENFDIHIGPPQNGRYPLTVTNQFGFELPQTVWQSLPQSQTVTDTLVYLRELIARDTDAKELGQVLRDFLFPQSIQLLFVNCQNKARQQGAGLRVRLRIQADQPELSLIPWEYCWGNKNFLALEADTPLVRYMPTDEPISPLAHSLPVKVLVVTADPGSTLNLSAELHHIETALSPLQDKNQAILQVVENATRQMLSEAVRQFSPDIFHFIGHGRVGEEGGTLLLVGENGRSDPVTAKDLVVLLRGSVKLAILNACHTAELPSDNTLLAVAHRLVWAGLPAVIGMQFKMPDETAESFSRELYQRLVEGQPLDTAVTQARVALYFNQQDKVFWAIPALFMRAPDGVLWRIPPPCPYRGLESFREDDAKLFRGRDDTIQRVVKAIQQKQQIVAVIGASGSGKSSLVFAGVLPKFRQQPGWHIVTMRPGRQPLVALQTALAQKPDTPTHTLLVIDQFEELYTFTSDRQVQNQFLDQLLTATNSTVVLTLRADFMGQALSHAAFAEVLETGDVKLGPMKREGMKEAIEEPAKYVEVIYQDGLVERILEEIAPHGQSPDAGDLPLLEFALTQLWAQQEKIDWAGQLTHRAYEAVGQVQGALKRHADGVYEQLKPAEKRQLPKLLTRLIHPGVETADTRLLVMRSELTAEQWHLARHLSAPEVRLVVTNQDENTEQETAELVHEALIQRWEKLQQWMQEERTFRLWQERLRAAMKQWVASQEDEGALLRGAPLGEAEGWLAEPNHELSSRERQFIEKSITLRDRETAEKEAQQQQALEQAQQLAEAQTQRALEQTRRTTAVRQASGMIGVLFLIAVGVAIFAGVQWNSALRSGRMILAQSLAALSQVIYQDSYDSELSALLAIEGYRMNQEENGNIAWLVDRSLRPLFDGSLSFFNTSLQGYGASGVALAFSPDGKILATASVDNSVILWNLSDFAAQPTILHGHESTITDLAFSPDGQTLASGSNDFTIRLWDMKNLMTSPIVLHGHEIWVEAVAFSPDGRVLASGGFDDAIRLWDLNNLAAEPLVLLGHGETVLSVAFSPDGKLLASGSEDNTIHLWSLSNLTNEPLILHGHEDRVGSVVFSPDGTILASGSTDSTIHLWNLSQLEAKPVVLHSYESSVFTVDFSPDGKTLASGGGNGLVYLWDLSSLDIEPVVLQGSQGGVLSVKFSPDGQDLASGGWGETIRLWDMSAAKAKPIVIHNDESPVSSLVFSSDGQSLAGGAGNGTTYLWNINSPSEELMMLSRSDNSILSLAFSPDGLILASADGSNAIHLWDVRHSEIEPIIINEESGVLSLAFSPDGQTLAIGMNSIIHLWEVGNPAAKVIVLQGHEGRVNSIVFSPDGQMLASGSENKTIHLWKIKDSAIESVILQGHQAGINSVVFSPDGLTLASGSDDYTIRLWNMENLAAESIILVGHKEEVQSVTFSPDGQTLASGSWDGTIRLWDMSSLGTKMQPIVLQGHGNRVSNRISSVAFSPDGQTLASGGWDGTTRLWILLDELIEVGCQQVRRNLTWVEWQRYLPGQPYRQTCPQWPVHSSVPEGSGGE